MSEQHHELRPHNARNGFAVKWGELIGNSDCPMMRRWVLETPIGSLRLHHFIRSDEDRAMHDHPWWFVSLPIRYGYEDLTWCPDCGGSGGSVLDVPETHEDGEVWLRIERVTCLRCDDAGTVAEKVRPWRLVWRRAGHAHQVRVTEAGAWTVIVTGRKRRRWGFWSRVGRFYESRRWFGLMGFPACADDDDLMDHRTAAQIAAYRAAIENQHWVNHPGISESDAYPGLR